MCGIAVVLHPNGSVALAAVRRMNAAQAHRGPDDAGEQVVPVGPRTLAFGHTRLSIQDLSPAGHQPMTNPSTGDVIVYNGELYNVAELSAELSSLGVSFRGHSDTEVILHAFARWGAGCVERFCGMFAFALWSPKDRTLHLVRDPLGIKPLYFAEIPDGFVVASELRGVLASGAVEPTIDRVAIASLLAYGAVAAPRTSIAGVNLVEPATWTEISIGSVRDRRRRTFWRFPDTRPEPSVPYVASELREPLERAIAGHLISDKPVGIFLSSGIDSTAIATLAARAHTRSVDTFCVSLTEDAALDESRAAAETARRIGTDHHEVRVSEAEALQFSHRWFASMDQPSVDGLNTFVISRAVREHGIVVVLSGLGGDEIFGGYSSFREVPLFRRMMQGLRWMPPSRRRALFRALAARMDGARSRKVGDIAASDGSLLDLWLLRRRLFSDEDMRHFGFDEPEWRANHYLPPDALANTPLPEDDWAAVRLLETRLYMGNMLLRDADVFGMSHGLEVRVPLLDRRVIDCALSYSRPGLFRGLGTNKPWITAALGDRFPSHLRSLPKRGFTLPQARWLAGPLRDEFAEYTEALAGAGLLEPAGVRRAWHDSVARGAGASWSRGWLLATLGYWVQRTSRHTKICADLARRTA